MFEDANHSFDLDAGELVAPSRVVYVDANDNQTLDANERLVLAGADGSFAFDGLPDGDYSIGLFNGSASQIQTAPIGTNGLGSVYPVADGNQLLATDTALEVLTADSIISVDPTNLGATNDGSTTIGVADQTSKMQLLPDGSFLVIGSDASGETAWQVDPSGPTVTAVDLSGSDPATLPSPNWSDLAIDGNGLGLVIEEGTGLVPVRSIDASDLANGISITTTSVDVPADTTVLTSATGTRSVLAWGSMDGLSLSLWSNSTSTLISSSPELIENVTAMLSFDDDSGLLVLRTSDGGISIHDVNADFAALHTVEQPLGPVAIDGQRDLLFAISESDGSLMVVNLQSGDEIASLAVDFTLVGTPTAIAAGSDNASILVLGSLGVSEIRMDQPASHRVSISGGVDVDAVNFGVSLIGENTAPRYETVPEFQTDEDTTFSESAPATVIGSLDDQADRYIVIQRSFAGNGSVTAGITGAIAYSPNQDFNGTDAFDVVLHDGRDVSDEVTLEIDVVSVPDPPGGIRISVDPLPEDAVAGLPFGDVEVIDGDGPGHLIEFDDERFGHQGGQIIFVGGPIDFETEPTIPVTITVTDSETSDQVQETFTVSLRNANDPITGILPTEAFVFENAPGDDIAELTVLDQDIQSEQFHTFTVDDDRFIIEEATLRLAPGISLDFETETEVIVNVTASEVGGSNSFTQAIVIAVRDLAEQPVAIGVTNLTVIEMINAAAVGSVTLDGATPNSRFNFQVDDVRFEVVESILKLADGQSVLRSESEEIQITITAVDSQNQFADVAETFVIQVLENETPAHNHDNPFDVNHHGDITALDALVIINYLNAFGPGPVGINGDGMCYDVNADGFVTALDALLIVNQINLIDTSGGVEGEGEQQHSPSAPLTPPAPLATPGMSSGNRFAESQPEPNSDWQSLGALPDNQSSRNSNGDDIASAQPATEQFRSAMTEAQLTDLEETIGLLSDRNA